MYNVSAPNTIEFEEFEKSNSENDTSLGLHVRFARMASHCCSSTSVDGHNVEHVNMGSWQLLSGLPAKLAAFDVVRICHVTAMELSDRLFTAEDNQGGDLLAVASALVGLAKEYNGVAREIVGLLERQRRAVTLWMNITKRRKDDHDGNAAQQHEELCALWDSLVTHVLELTSKHGQVMEALALDTEVYSQACSRLVATQTLHKCGADATSNPARCQLIRTATDACSLTSDQSAQLAVILQPVRAARRSAAQPADSTPQSPIVAPTAAVRRVIDIDASLWETLENALATTTTALSTYASTLCSIVALLQSADNGTAGSIPSLLLARDGSGKQGTVNALDDLVALIATTCRDTCAHDILGRQSLLSLAPPHIGDVLRDDPYLRGYARKIIDRHAAFQRMLHRIDVEENGLDVFSQSYRHYGFSVVNAPSGTEGGAGRGRIRLREWCPGAAAVSLVGDFNGWDASAHPARREGSTGCWTVDIPHGPDNTPAIARGSFVKLSVTVAHSNEVVTRIPAWIERAVQPKGQTDFVGVYTPPEDLEYVRRHPRPARPTSLRIYEAHVGIGSKEPCVASYKSFTTDVLPRIAAQKYNCVQLMAVMEHAYYGSFGYQVTNFFAASSRFGPLRDLMELVDTAHGLGLVVLLDVVHSHASKNTTDGLNMYDGTDGCFFHEGHRGNHPLWDSRCFNYGSMEVLRFLLSNLRWYLDVYGFDGFRFDGVTSMLYTHHGMYKTFAGYDDYFDDSVDTEAIVYLMLANCLVHDVVPSAITIAEDVSGLPLLGRSMSAGGVGFDYRLSMGVPDYWIKIIKELRDEDWDMNQLVHVLTNRRYKEPVIVYAESHDQALVGDKTLAFWLMDKEMYTHMSVLSENTHVIDRGMALHKLIRMVTHTLGGEGYLNFMGNEFGHPEWLDFPRKENGESYHYARRQWNLVDDELLRYRFLNNFDRTLNDAETVVGWLHPDTSTYVSLKHDADKVIVFERGNAVFAFNFHITNSYTDYRIGAPVAGSYSLLLCSDDEEFGGHARIAQGGKYFTTPDPWNNRPCSLQIYLPARTAIVLTPFNEDS
eukprot:m.870187 g.870187  ORF g.870187 m.870187 type:complete len:1058 (+) comp23565_c1_seq3:61-3234(+)